MEFYLMYECAWSLESFILTGDAAEIVFGSGLKSFGLNCKFWVWSD